MYLCAVTVCLPDVSMCQCFPTFVVFNVTVLFATYNVSFMLCHFFNHVFVSFVIFYERHIVLSCNLVVIYFFIRSAILC